MSNQLRDFIINKIINPTIISNPFIAYGTVLSKGKDIGEMKTVNVRIAYGNPDSPSHYNPNGEIIKDVPVNMPGAGAISADLKSGDNVVVGFVNGDQNAPYILSAPRYAYQSEQKTQDSGYTSATEGVPQTNIADSSFIMKDLKTISSQNQLTNLITSIHNNIAAISDTPTWDPNCRVFIDISHDESDPGDIMPDALSERDINLILGLKLKEFLILGGAHKNSIKTSRNWSDVSMNYEEIAKDIYENFHPTIIVSIHTAHAAGVINRGISAVAVGSGEKQNLLADKIKETIPDQFQDGINTIRKNESSTGSAMINALINNPHYIEIPAPYLEFYYFSITEQSTKIDTVNEIYKVALGLANAILKTLNVKPLEISISMDMLIQIIIEIIYGNETSGGYTMANNDYLGLFSVGRAQWTKDRAKNILKKIKERNEANGGNAWSLLAQSIKDEVFSATSWDKKTATQSEIDSVKAFLACPESQKAQDEQMIIDVSAYINNAKIRGVKDLKSIAYMADIEHQYGTGGCNSLYKRLNLQNPSLLEFYNAIQKDSEAMKYKNRRTNTYNKLKDLNI